MKKINRIVLTSLIFISFSWYIFADERKPHTFGSGDVLSAEMLNEMFNATSLDLGETLIGIWATSCLDSKVANNDLDSPGTGTLTINSITTPSVSYTGVSCLNVTYSDFSGFDNRSPDS